MDFDHRDLRLRRAAPGDEDMLALLGAATFLDSYADLIDGPDILAHCQRQHASTIYADWLASADPRHAIWLVEHKRTRAPVAYATLNPPDTTIESGPGDIELKRIYVLSRFHGTGAGQALMDAALAHAQSMSAPRMLIGTYQGNARAIAFYTRNGFAQTGVRKFQVGGEVFDDIVLARSLN